MSRPTVIFLNTRNTALEADPCFAAAKRLGLDVVLMTDRKSLAPPGMTVEVCPVDTYHIDACLAAARDVARRRDVVGVVTWGDRDVEPTAAIAEDLGLPGAGVAAARIARNKYRTREAVGQLRTDLVPRYQQVTTHDDLRDALTSVGFPAVLKPTGASASRGIFRVAGPSQAEAAFAELLRFTRAESDPIFRYYAGELILEEELGGSEHSVEGIVVAGELQAAFVTDKWVAAPFFLETQQISGTRLSGATRNLLVQAARDVVTAVGYRDGAIHLEMRVEAPDRVRMLELNGRTGGNYITSHLVSWSTGYEFLANVLRVATGQQPEGLIDPTAQLVAGSRQVLTALSGTLQGVRGVDQALSLPGMRQFCYETAPGSQVAQPPVSYSSSIIASLLGVATDQGGLEALLDAAAAQLSIDVT